MKIVITPEAEADISEAFWSYEGQREDLGLRFRDALKFCLGIMERHPRAYAVIEGELRRGILRTFPYGVFYKIEDETIVVVAVLHLSRNPDTWRQRS